MTALCFATRNAHKLAEVRAALSPYSVTGLDEIGCTEELPEDHATLEENSLQKAMHVFTHYGVACFADDSGLEVEALGGAPGAWSAMYAGPMRDHAANNALLLKNLEGVSNRRARFRTVITLAEAGGSTQFEGVVNGVITNRPEGEGGFGYDPIFRPDGYSCTMAMLTMDEKNAISHRGAAVRKLAEYLRHRKG